MHSNAFLAPAGLLALIPVADIGHAQSSPLPEQDPAALEPDDGWQRMLRRYPRPPIPMTVPDWWITPGDFPDSASESEIEGVLAYRVAVDTSGEVTGCEITQSSGVAAFDHRACAAVSSRALFYPARGDQQQAAAGLWDGWVIWLMEEPRYSRQISWAGWYDGEGRLIQCGWNGGIVPDLDPKPFCEEGQLRSASSALYREGMPQYVSGWLSAAEVDALATP